VKKGDWVEIHSVILAPGERAPQVPDDTRRVPLEMRVRGFLLEDAVAGERAGIRTRAGRLLSGTLFEDYPSYDHSFGPPPPELISIGDEVRSMLASETRSPGRRREAP
jgi:hypothetical protein